VWNKRLFYFLFAWKHNGMLAVKIVEVYLHSFFNFGARWGGWSTPRPGRFTPGKESRYPLYRRLRGPQGRSGQGQRISPPPGFDPRTVQPVMTRYSDWAIPAHRSFPYRNIGLPEWSKNMKEHMVVRVVYNSPPPFLLEAMFTHVIYHILSWRMSCYPTHCSRVMLLDASWYPLT
jgi:hypothetical protein